MLEQLLSAPWYLEAIFWAVGAIALVYVWAAVAFFCSTSDESGWIVFASVGLVFAACYVVAIGVRVGYLFGGQ